MKYISIDIETTGLDAETCQILSIGAVIEDTNNILPFELMPRFHCVIPHEKITGEIFALNLNKNLIGLINNYHMAKSPAEWRKLSNDNNVVFIYERNVVKAFQEFMASNGLGLGKTTIVGKNYQGFDQKFLTKLEGWENLGFHRRIGDPAILFVDWKNDTEFPDLNTCKIRSGVSGEVTHDALHDAFDVVEILRTKY